MEVNLKYCYIAAFADGSRLRFPGISFEDCYSRICDAVSQHGDVTWYDAVTDELYDSGILSASIPEPPVLPIVDLTDGPAI